MLGGAISSPRIVNLSRRPGQSIKNATSVIVIPGDFTGCSPEVSSDLAPAYTGRWRN